MYSGECSRHWRFGEANPVVSRGGFPEEIEIDEFSRRSTPPSLFMRYNVGTLDAFLVADNN